MLIRSDSLNPKRCQLIVQRSNRAGGFCTLVGYRLTETQLCWIWAGVEPMLLDWTDHLFPLKQLRAAMLVQLFGRHGSRSGLVGSEMAQGGNWRIDVCNRDSRIFELICVSTSNQVQSALHKTGILAVHGWGPETILSFQSNIVLLLFGQWELPRLRNTLDNRLAYLTDVYTFMLRSGFINRSSWVHSLLPKTSWTAVVLWLSGERFYKLAKTLVTKCSKISLLFHSAFYFWGPGHSILLSCWWQSDRVPKWYVWFHCSWEIARTLLT